MIGTTCDKLFSDAEENALATKKRNMRRPVKLKTVLCDKYNRIVTMENCAYCIESSGCASVDTLTEDEKNDE